MVAFSLLVGSFVRNLFGAEKSTCTPIIVQRDGSTPNATARDSTVVVSLKAPETNEAEVTANSPYTSNPTSKRMESGGCACSRARREDISDASAIDCIVMISTLFVHIKI